MKRKIRIMLALFCICILSACNEEIEIPNVFLPEDDTTDQNQEVELGLPSEYTSIEVMDNLALVLSQKNNYIKSQSGTSYGTSSGFEAVQAISNKTYKYNKSFFLDTVSETTKSFLNISADVYHKAYFSGDEVAFNHSSDEISNSKTPTVSSEDDYEDEYGLLANSLDFTGYVIDNDTINSVNEDVVDGVYTYSFDLNTTTSCEGMYIQMTRYGGITDLIFTSIEVVVSIDSEWNILALDTKEVYSAKKYGATIRMTQELSTKFTFFDPNDNGIELPNISNYLNALT